MIISLCHLLVRKGSEFHVSSLCDPHAWYDCHAFYHDIQGFLWCLLQSPATTVIWIAALNTIALPAVSFGHDASLFCVAFNRSEILLYLVNTVFAVLCSFLGPWWFDVLDIYHFYHLPWAFRWKMYWRLGLFMLVYVT